MNKVAEHGQARKTPATQKQKYLMKKLGIDFNENISLYSAMSKINTKIRQNKKKMY